VPIGVEPLVVTFIVAWPDPPLMGEEGLKLTPTPVGKLPVLKLTFPVNPFDGATVTV
jgi:hypothetical protein